MRTFIVKRKKDSAYLTLGENEMRNTLTRTAWNGTTFEKEFELVCEEKDIRKEMESLFGSK